MVDAGPKPTYEEKMKLPPPPPSPLAQGGHPPGNPPGSLPSGCHTVWNGLLDLIWVQIVCKDVQNVYQQMTKFAARRRGNLLFSRKRNIEYPTLHSMAPPPLHILAYVPLYWFSVFATENENQAINI